MCEKGPGEDRLMLSSQEPIATKIFQYGVDRTVEIHVCWMGLAAMSYDMRVRQIVRLLFVCLICFEAGGRSFPSVTFGYLVFAGVAAVFGRITSNPELWMLVFLALWTSRQTERTLRSRSTIFARSTTTHAVLILCIMAYLNLLEEHMGVCCRIYNEIVAKCIVDLPMYDRFLALGMNTQNQFNTS